MFDYLSMFVICVVLPPIIYVVYMSWRLVGKKTPYDVAMEGFFGAVICFIFALHTVDHHIEMFPMAIIWDIVVIGLGLGVATAR